MRTHGGSIRCAPHRSSRCTRPARWSRSWVSRRWRCRCARHSTFAHVLHTAFYHRYSRTARFAPRAAHPRDGGTRLHRGAAGTVWWANKPRASPDVGHPEIRTRPGIAGAGSANAVVPTPESFATRSTGPDWMRYPELSRRRLHRSGCRSLRSRAACAGLGGWLEAPAGARHQRRCRVCGGSRFSPCCLPRPTPATQLAHGWGSGATIPRRSATSAARGVTLGSCGQQHHPTAAARQGSGGGTRPT